MSSIDQIMLKNIKFFHNETIEISKNVLFYGENGSGKSSLYWALKIYFEHLTGIISDAKKEEFFNQENPKNLLNRNYLTESHELNIRVTSAVDITKDTIHFINHKTLSDIFSTQLDGTVDFFDILDHDWFKKYTLFDNLREKDLVVGSVLNSASKNEFDSSLKKIIATLQFKTNKIMKNNFGEKLIKIKFKYIDTEIGQDALSLVSQVAKLPNIQILVNKISNPQHHFNEAKLKLISLAIHFAVIELSKPDESYNGLRLAVFDDFLQSLDMSYRSVVLDYVFDQMIVQEKYQVILLTHDLAFYKLVKRKSELYDQTHNWEFKNIYVRETIENGIPSTEPRIHGIKSYFEDAQQSYEENKLEECGNLLRKELERILSLFLVNLSLGHKEMAQQMIDYLQVDKKIDTFYFDPHKIVYGLKNTLKTSIKILENAKVTDCTNKIEKILQIQQKALNEFDSFKQIDVKRLRTILKRLNYHKDTLLNSTSHVNEEDLIRGEFKKAIEDIKDLKNIIDNPKKSQNDNIITANSLNAIPETGSCSFFTLLKKLIRLN